jgi:hypothetical protein
MTTDSQYRRVARLAKNLREMGALVPPPIRAAVSYEWCQQAARLQDAYGEDCIFHRSRPQLRVTQ